MGLWASLKKIWQLHRCLGAGGSLYYVSLKYLVMPEKNKWVNHMCVFLPDWSPRRPKNLGTFAVYERETSHLRTWCEACKSGTVRFEFNFKCILSEEFGCVLWNGWAMSAFALKCDVFRIFSLLYSLPSVPVRPEGTIWLAFLSASVICFSLRKKLGEFKQLGHLAFDLATPRISICHI